jgi:hypothetical protein
MRPTLSRRTERLNYLAGNWKEIGRKQNQALLLGCPVAKKIGLLK